MITNLRFASIAAMLALALGGAAQAQSPTQKSITRADYLKTVDARFAIIDANHDGIVSRAEMVAQQQRDLQTARNKVAQDLRGQFARLDTNKDNQLSLQEFLAAAPTIRTAETPDQVVQKYDANHDGKVTPAEYRGPEIAKFNRLDTNHDGVVTQAEIVAGARK